MQGMQAPNLLLLWVQSRPSASASLSGRLAELRRGPGSAASAASARLLRGRSRALRRSLVGSRSSPGCCQLRQEMGACLPP